MQNARMGTAARLDGKTHEESGRCRWPTKSTLMNFHKRLFSTKLALDSVFESLFPGKQSCSRPFWRSSPDHPTHCQSDHIREILQDSAR